MSKTGPRCTVCASDHRHRIEIGLVAGLSARALADKFDLSKDAIHRHKENHLTAATRAGILAARAPSEIDLDALRADESAGLLSQLVGQRARLQQHGDLALSLGDVRACVSVESAITSNLTLVGRLLGQLAVQYNVTHTSVSRKITCACVRRWSPPCGRFPKQRGPWGRHCIDWKPAPPPTSLLRLARAGRVPSR